MTTSRQRVCSQKLDWLAHGGLDEDALEVVPALLEQGGQEVKAHHDVLAKLFITHVNSADGVAEAGDLLELELDGCADILDCGQQGCVVRDDLGEPIDPLEDRSKDGGNLLDQRVRSQQKSVLLCPALDELLVLVELLE